jgi:hypothetical protein
MSEATVAEGETKQDNQVAAPGEDQTDAVVEKKRISVFNLPPGITTKDDLRDLCKPYGSVVEVEFIPVRGQKPAFGFVTFRTGADAEFAIYRLNHSNLGSKGPLKAGFPADRPKRDPNVEKKKKPKKPLNSLSLLTPKNNANLQNTLLPPTPPPQGNGKKGWDMNRTQSPQQTPPTQNRRQQQGGGYQKKTFPNDPNAQNQNQFQQQRVAPANNAAVPQQQQHAAQHVPAAQQAAPAQQALAHPGQPPQADGQFVQNPGQPKAPKKKRNKGGNGQQNPQQNGQPAQFQQNGHNLQNNQPQPPQPNQGQPNQGQPNQGQPNQGQPPRQQNQPGQQNNQQAKPQQTQQNQPGQGKGPKGKKNTAYVCHVVDPRTKLVLHVLELNQAQFDQHLLPLVQVQ